MKDPKPKTIPDYDPWFRSRGYTQVEPGRWVEPSVGETPGRLEFQIVDQTKVRPRWNWIVKANGNVLGRHSQQANAAPLRVSSLFFGGTLRSWKFSQFTSGYSIYFPWLWGDVNTFVTSMIRLLTEEPTAEDAAWFESRGFTRSDVEIQEGCPKIPAFALPSGASFFYIAGQQKMEWVACDARESWGPSGFTPARAVIAYASYLQQTIEENQTMVAKLQTGIDHDRTLLESLGVP